MKQDPRFKNLFILDHPLIQHKLSHMRDRDTSTRTFRELLREITLLMGYEITRNLQLTTKRVATPLVEIDAPVIAGKKLAIVPVLRAGIGMSDGLLDLIPSARVGHIGVYRADDGEISFAGETLSGANPLTVARRGISRTFQHNALFKHLSVIDNVMAGLTRQASTNILEHTFSLPRARAEEQAFLKRVLSVLNLLGIAQHANAIVATLPSSNSAITDLVFES